jgi:hypothetical protein
LKTVYIVPAPYKVRSPHAHSARPINSEGDTLNRISTIVAVGLALAGALSAAPAKAAARTFVSGHGNDGNPCNLAGPCRTFAAAYAKTDAAGEISVLDVAGYGPLTITTALSIINDGVGESGIILIAAGNAITINAGSNDAVTLRGLSLDGGNTASTNGIAFNSGANLTVQNCTIRHFAGSGIGFLPNSPSSLSVSNTLVANNGGNGIAIVPNSAASVTAVLNRVEVYNNGGGVALNGINTTASIEVTVSESIAAGNVGAGFSTFTPIGNPSPVSISLFHSVATHNGTGLTANGPQAVIILAQSMVAYNTVGWQLQFGGIIGTFADNYVTGNGISTGSLTTVAKQ